MTPLPTGTRPDVLEVAFFPNVFEQRPLVRRVSWMALAARLGRFPTERADADKRRLPCWAPAAWVSDGGGWRLDSLSALVLDVDGGQDIDEALGRCDGLTVAVHTSWSHTPTSPRFRVVLPLAAPIPVGAWSSVWHAAVTALRIPADAACVNANRRYLLPARRGSGSPTRSEMVTSDRALDASGWVQTAGRVCGRGSAPRTRASTFPCPACARQSVWFLLPAGKSSVARCNHRNSCGWSGPAAPFAHGAS